MAFLRGYQHDVFVSYAHNDNQTDVPGDVGWVRNLVNFLRTRTVQKLGDSALDIWMDYKLAGNEAVTPALMEELAGSAVLVFVSSESYLASGWCKRELAGFLSRSVTDRKVGSLTRLFMINRDKIDRSSLPEGLSDLIGYQFWKEEGGQPIPLGYPVPNSNQTEYWSSVNKLSSELAETLKCLASPNPTEIQKTGPIVHLAEVTEDLEPLRQEVEGFLEQAGITILPRTYYPRENPVKFQAEIDGDLEVAKLFVQLLSVLPGRKPAELPQGYPGLQFQRAQVKGKEILQWRSPDIDVRSVPDEEYRKLLSAKTVIAEGIEGFKERVRKRAFAKPISVTPPGPKVIFVNTESGDRQVAEQVANCIMRKGFGFALSQETSIRKDLKTKLQECHGAIIVYASSPAKWVERQQTYIRKILQEINPPPPIITIFEKRQQRTDFVNYRYWPTIEFSSEIDCDALEPFLQDVRVHQR